MSNIWYFIKKWKLAWFNKIIIAIFSYAWFSAIVKLIWLEDNYLASAAIYFIVYSIFTLVDNKYKTSKKFEKLLDSVWFTIIFWIITVSLFLYDYDYDKRN